MTINIELSNCRIGLGLIFSVLYDTPWYEKCVQNLKLQKFIIFGQKVCLEGAAEGRCKNRVF
jgi:hypothetical protein